MNLKVGLSYLLTYMRVNLSIPVVMIWNGMVWFGLIWLGIAFYALAKMMKVPLMLGVRATSRSALNYPNRLLSFHMLLFVICFGVCLVWHGEHPSCKVLGQPPFGG